MRNYLFLGRPADMDAPEEYVRFTQRRRLWQELGLTWDAPHREVAEALLFMRLEDRYRPKSEDKGAS